MKFLVTGGVGGIGIYSQMNSYNPITMRIVDNVRNTGLFGKVTTIFLGINLFFIMAAYACSTIEFKKD